MGQLPQGTVEAGKTQAQSLAHGMAERDSSFQAIKQDYLRSHVEYVPSFAHFRYPSVKFWGWSPIEQVVRYLERLPEKPIR